MNFETKKLLQVNFFDVYRELSKKSNRSLTLLIVTSILLIGAINGGITISEHITSDIWGITIGIELVKVILVILVTANLAKVVSLSHRKRKLREKLLINEIGEDSLKEKNQSYKDFIETLELIDNQEFITSVILFFLDDEINFFSLFGCLMTFFTACIVIILPIGSIIYYIYDSFQQENIAWFYVCVSFSSVLLHIIMIIKLYIDTNISESSK